MAWFDFFWTDEALEKIAQHGVDADEVEYVVQSPVDIATSKSTVRDLAMGFTEAGRWVVCVYEMVDAVTVMPITAYEPTKGPE